MERIRGDPADNIERAIKAYEDVLEVLTRDAAVEWAMTQHSLAGAYANRIREDRADIIERAIKASKDALGVYTRTAMPRHNMRSLLRLAEVHLNRRDWLKARDALGSAQKTFRLLLGQGLNEDEARDLIERAGSLFTNASFAAIELSNPDNALELLEEGKAQLLALALRQQSLNLPLKQAARFERLKTEIHDLSRRVDSAKGTEGVDALRRLSALRGELSILIERAAKKNTSLGSALAMARALVPSGGAIIAPIVTKFGGKTLIVTSNNPTILVVDLPRLTSASLDHELEAGWMGKDRQADSRKWSETIENRRLIWRRIQSQANALATFTNSLPSRTSKRWLPPRGAAETMIVHFCSSPAFAAAS